MNIRVGVPAPDFTATSDDGRCVHLAALRGSWVVLFFYPKADSPGCTLEARAFQRALPEFEALGVHVIGVSTDTEATQAKLRHACGLSFPLVPDGERRVGRAYDVHRGVMSVFGRVNRETFLIDPSGLIAHHWKRVRPGAHARDVLHEVRRRLTT